MRITIETEGKRFWVALPTGLLLNPVSAGIAAGVIQKKCPEILITAGDIMKLMEAIRICRHNYSNWEIVNVESAGEKIRIRL